MSMGGITAWATSHCLEASSDGMWSSSRKPIQASRLLPCCMMAHRALPVLETQNLKLRDEVLCLCLLQSLRNTSLWASVSYSSNVG